MNEVICTSCGYRGPMRVYGCMQVGLTVFLAFFFILPGILYALYVDSWRKRCPVCDQGALIPVNSPRGQQLLASMPEIASAVPFATPPLTSEEIAKGSRARTIGIMFAIVFVMGLLLTVLFHRTPASATAEPPTPTEQTSTTPPPPISETVDGTTIVSTPVETTTTAEAPRSPVAAGPPLFLRTATSAPPPKAFDEIRSEVAAAGDVFIEISGDYGRVYHEATCPTANQRMRRATLGYARAEGYTPAWDCHKPQR